jgi:hypothetical protein
LKEEEEDEDDDEDGGSFFLVNLNMTHATQNQIQIFYPRGRERAEMSASYFEEIRIDCVFNMERYRRAR